MDLRPGLVWVSGYSGRVEDVVTIAFPRAECLLLSDTGKLHDAAGDSAVHLWVEISVRVHFVFNAVDWQNEEWHTFSVSNEKRSQETPGCTRGCRMAHFQRAGQSSRVIRVE